MPSAPARKPPGAKESWSLSSGTQKCGAGVLVIGVIIGLSHYYSPVDDDVPMPPMAPPDPAVTSLDDTSFDKFLAAHPQGVLVDFYSQSCGFCTKLAPELEKAAQKLKTDKGPMLASVDQETGAEIHKKFGIERLPTVLWFWQGKNVLELPRASEKKAEAIVTWAQWAADPAVQELDTRAEFDGALATLRSSLPANGRLMVLFSRTGSEGMREAFEEAAQRHRAKTVLLYIKEGLDDSTELHSYGKEESKDEVYSGSSSVESVVAWVKGTLEKAKPPKAADPSPDQAEGAEGHAASESDGKE